MKNLLLLGDSIRDGYGCFVKARLIGKAHVFYPQDNCRFAQYTLREVNHWIAKCPELDVIHWNNGLWDIIHLGLTPIGNDGEAAGLTIKPANVTGDFVYDKDPLTPPDMYELMLNRIVLRLKQLCPKAEIVFATTTPVVEEEASYIYRSNAEVAQYNDIARQVMQKHNIRVNELGAFAQTLGKEYRRDWVHYTDEGSDLLAGEIVDYLQKENLI